MNSDDVERWEHEDDLLFGIDLREDSEAVESSHDKSLRWLDELVVHRADKLNDDQVIELAKVYILKDLVQALRPGGS